MQLNEKRKGPEPVQRRIKASKSDGDSRGQYSESERGCAGVAGMNCDRFYTLLLALNGARLQELHGQIRLINRSTAGMCCSLSESHEKLGVERPLANEIIRSHIMAPAEGRVDKTEKTYFAFALSTETERSNRSIPSHTLFFVDTNVRCQKEHNPGASSDQ